MSVFLVVVVRLYACSLIAMIISSLRVMNKKIENLSKNKWFMRGMIIFLVSIGLILIEATGVWLIRKHWSLMYIFNVGYVYVWSSILVLVSCCIYFSILVYVARRSKEELPERYNGLVNNQVLLLALVFVLYMCGTFVGAILGSGLASLGQGVFGISSVEKRVYSAQNWNNIKERLYKDSNLCAQLQQKFGDDSQDVFFARRLDNLQSGCCKPPKECNFNYSSPIVWIKRENGTHPNEDCQQWDNDPEKLCYNCQVCKHSYTRKLKKTWMISGAIVLIACVMLIPGLILMHRELARS